MIWFWFFLSMAALCAAPALRERLRSPQGGAARREATGTVARLFKGATRYEWSGPENGPVTLCIHGLTTSSYVWSQLIPLLTAQGRRVLTYDLYGRGGSERPTDLQDPAFFVDQATELLDHLEVTAPVDVIGYSMGGAITTVLASQHPHRVRGVTLLAPAGMIHASGRLIRFCVRVPIFGDWLFHIIYPLQHRLWVRGAAQGCGDQIAINLAREVTRRGYVPAILSSLRGTLSKQLIDEHQAVQKAGIKVLAIWGENDAVIPLASKALLESWNPDARHLVIDGADHSLAFLNADAVADALDASKQPKKSSTN